MVHCQLDDQYALDQVIKAFLRATREERAHQAQQQQKIREAKEGISEFNFAQALLNMAKMMIENNQRIMTENNQRMMEMVTKVVEQPRNINQQPQGNNRASHQPY